MVCNYDYIIFNNNISIMCRQTNGFEKFTDLYFKK